MQLQLANKKGVDIREGMMGLFFEDINYGADGGLYAELIENRSFEFLKTTGVNNAYTPEYDGGYGWIKYPVNSPFVAMEYHTFHPLTEENPHYLHVKTTRPGCGFSNKAYDGIFLKNREEYRVSFYMNALSYTGDITVLVEKDGDVFLKGSVFVTGENNGWKKYEMVLRAEATVDAGVFHILLENPGEVEFDCISMMSCDAVCGVFRKDIANLLKDIKPGFLRFPGGCIIEGNDLKNRYQWKKSVGNIIKRKANWNRWAVHMNCEANNFTSEYAYYNQTLGIGFYEYFLLCEYIGAKAVPVVSVGLACQFQSEELVEVDTPEFQEYIQDALDLVEFANGDVTTTWGALRAEMGHPEPFGLEFIGIGNEQWETEKVDFFRRYTLFEEAIHKKYPEIKLIGSAGPDVHSERYHAAWNFYREAVKDNREFTYAVDEHYYMPPEWFLANTHFYDNYSRDIKVFSGEYAAHPKRLGGMRSANTLEGALGEAAFLTGVERNADVVIMASYAPLLARVGYVQWAPDMIWFDAKTAYGTPSYHVQKMYANNMGTYTLAMKAEECAELEKHSVFANASFDEKSGEIILKVVNAGKDDFVLNLVTEEEITAGTALCLSGPDLYAYNTIEEPNKVAVKEWELSAEECKKLVLPAESFKVYRFTV